MKFYFIYHISKRRYLHVDVDGGLICTFSTKDALNVPDAHLLPRTKKDAIARLGSFHALGMNQNSNKHFKRYGLDDLVVKEVEIELTHSDIDQDNSLMIQNAFVSCVINSHVNILSMHRWERSRVLQAGCAEFFKSHTLSHAYYVLHHSEFENNDFLKQLKSSGINHKYYKDLKTISFYREQDWQMFQLMFTVDSNRVHTAQFIFDSMYMAMQRKVARDFFQPHLPEVLFRKC